ncbi:hypothetical protein N7517_004701 [Penicillium concentricum]|uniref:Uncharacterized protein n=1 Tax=Penicillium concentricum TaxID=293559 RepID=A0A9W9S6C6_9EURO|nr:uncharacterized protein N7517_004701 [Penicillium concentricum]KAJ5372695.1 hypothetical protein N7517_004701 [Penicillium concentricum]
MIINTVSRHIPKASHEVHDSYDPSTFTTFARQRQPTVQRPSTSADPQFRPPSASDSQRPLRRIPRQTEVRQSVHRRTVSLGARVPHPNRLQPARTTPVSVQHAASGIAALRPALSEAETDDNGSTVDDPYQLLNTSYWPQRNTGVSSRTASAVLFALEEAIRGPLQLSTDWDEVNASMSDMVGVAGPAGPVGNSRVQNGGARVPQNPISGTSQPPSGMRTPTDIMRQRRDREARRKAEHEAQQREQEELERQQLEQEQQAHAEAQAQIQAQAQQYAAGVAAENASQSRIRAPRAPRGSEGPPQTMPVASGPASAYRPAAEVAPSTRPSEYQTAPPTAGTGQLASQSRPTQATGQPQHGRSQSAAEIGAQSRPIGVSKSTQALPAGQPGAPQALQQPKRVGFPHAFERWETLSSHWEGLTSYWMRKLEQNNEDLERDPISQQLARQITDLSAAGANLFHAVVELQRLRASSERKFQRWFFDTRAEQERSKEVQADLDRQLKEERQGRADAFSAAQEAEKDKVKAEELLKEMRRELQISKEEARRAWEELGRREQEERDRTNSLRNGEPTLVGGVQVVPMVSGLPSRHTTRPQTREGSYPGGPTATTMGTDSYHGKSTGGAGGQYYEDGTPMSPTGSDPFIEPKKVDPPASKAPYPGPLYEHENTSVPYPGPTTSEPDTRSYVGSSEAGDEDYAPYSHDQHGNPVSYPPGPSSEGSEEYDPEGQYMPDGAYTSAASSAPLQAPHPPTSAADYSGSGWGPGTGWESVTPRHRHPTRLSDVLEEDEPSRTNPSRATSRSQASRSQASRSIL